MKRRISLRKVVDEVSVIRCASGRGVIREEVWIDGSGQVARYNLAFIQHQLTKRDHGRVLGYDNSHGHHHCHRRGQTETIHFDGYDRLVARFLDEVKQLRMEMP